MSGRPLWVIVLAVFLILGGLLLVTNLKFEAQNLLLGVGAIASGVLALVGK